MIEGFVGVGLVWSASPRRLSLVTPEHLTIGAPEDTRPCCLHACEHSDGQTVITGRSAGYEKAVAPGNEVRTCSGGLQARTFRLTLSASVPRLPVRP